ncbi:MAG TPA: thioredoxin family protein [archaeon]|nr:thioredoxin family protein [archaeon]
MELGTADFNGQTLKRARTLAAVFLASWCSFCMRFLPAFEAAAKAAGISWAIVDVSDYDNELWDAFNIEIVPSIVIFKDGKPAWRRDGIPGRGLSAEVISEAVGEMKSLSAQT